MSSGDVLLILQGEGNCGKTMTLNHLIRLLEKVGAYYELDKPVEAAGAEILTAQKGNLLEWNEVETDHIAAFIIENSIVIVSTGGDTEGHIECSIRAFTQVKYKDGRRRICVAALHYQDEKDKKLKERLESFGSSEEMTIETIVPPQQIPNDKRKSGVKDKLQSCAREKAEEIYGKIIKFSKLDTQF